MNNRSNYRKAKLKGRMIEVVFSLSLVEKKTFKKQILIFLAIVSFFKIS